jgi:hypothetical protein
LWIPIWTCELRNEVRNICGQSFVKSTVACVAGSRWGSSFIGERKRKRGPAKRATRWSAIKLKSIKLFGINAQHALTRILCFT